MSKTSTRRRRARHRDWNVPASRARTPKEAPMTEPVVAIADITRVDSDPLHYRLADDLRGLATALENVPEFAQIVARQIQWSQVMVTDLYPDLPSDQAMRHARRVVEPILGQRARAIECDGYEARCWDMHAVTIKLVSPRQIAQSEAPPEDAEPSPAVNQVDAGPATQPMSARDWARVFAS